MAFVNARIKILSPLMDEIGFCWQHLLGISRLYMNVMGW